MELQIDEDLVTICKSIVHENKSLDEWSDIENDDIFQTDKYSGGFDADEEAFCFSYYDQNENEFWFQISFDEVSDIALGKAVSISLRQPE